MELRQRQMTCERRKIVRNAGRLRAARWIGDAFAPAASIKGDRPVAGSDKTLELRPPAGAGAGIGVQQDDRDAIAAAVPIAQPDAGQICEGNWRAHGVSQSKRFGRDCSGTERRGKTSEFPRPSPRSSVLPIPSLNASICLQTRPNPSPAH
jgi:hypothetical protein